MERFVAFTATLRFAKAILKEFNADFDANVAKANKNWPDLVAKHGK